MSFGDLFCGCFGSGSRGGSNAHNSDATLVAGVQVPGSSLGGREICHDFAYRYIAASGRAPELGSGGLGQEATARLWGTNRGQPVRVDGVIRARAGDLIGFWDASGQLQHSMIAESADTWFGANNTGSFGMATGRTRVSQVGSRVHGAADNPSDFPCGWVGNGNQWQPASGGAALTVTFRSSAEGVF